METGKSGGSREHSPIALASLPSSDSLARVQPRDIRAEWRRQFWRITLRRASTERCVAGLHDHWQPDDNHIGSPGQQGTTAITITPSGGFTGSVAMTASITSGPAGAQDLGALCVVVGRSRSNPLTSWAKEISKP
jgi:hypothetical protein